MSGLVLAAALAQLSSAPLVSWRGGTGSWLDESAWDNGHPAYAQQVQVSGLASIVTLDDAAWTLAVMTLWGRAHRSGRDRTVGFASARAAHSPRRRRPP